MNKSKIMSFGISTMDIAGLLKDKYNFPKDIIITRFERPANQDAWIVNIYSPEFPEHGALDILSVEVLKPGYTYSKEEQ